MDASSAREEAIRTATVDAITSSLTVGRLAASVFDHAQPLAAVSNPHVEADLRVALETLRTGIRSAHLTAVANLDVLARHRDNEDDLDPQVASFEATVSKLEDTQKHVELLASMRTGTEG